MHVLLVDHADFLGGAQQSELEVLRLADTQHFCVALACPEGELANAARAQGTRVLPLDLAQVRGMRNLPSAPYELAMGVRSLINTIRKHRSHVVHSNSMRASIYTSLAAKIARRKFVWHVHDLHRERTYVQFMSALADGIVANSRAALDLLPRSAQSKAVVAYPGLQINQFSPEAFDRNAIRAEFGIAPHELLVGNVGWLAPWKGQRAFIEAASLMAAQCPDTRFMIVGAASDMRYADYARELRQYGNRLLGEKLIWAGTRTDIARVMCALDLLLHCATREPFGRVLTEAMAMQVPIVAFRDGGPDEIVDDGVTGLLIAHGDTPALADAA
ncbi:MAG: glycosyltransferase, partial [Chloroflexi bacterium]|nr:glycosyltransferase [Chloroflexota bacterium]